MFCFSIVKQESEQNLHFQLSAKRMIYCTIDILLCSKTMPGVEGCDGNRGQLFTENYWIFFPLSCSGLGPTSVIKDLALLPCLRGLGKVLCLEQEDYIQQIYGAF